MDKKIRAKTLIFIILTLTFVVGLSIISNRLWQTKSENHPDINDLIFSEEMTVAEFGKANNLPNTVLKELFDLHTKTDLDKQLNEFGSSEQIFALINKKLALAAEHASKNWVKIPVKFVCWFIFLITLFLMFRKREISQAIRKKILLVSIFVFGIVLGSDPSPMGTVKDAIHLFGKSGAIFPPRMIALIIFLFIVFLANKYICAWGCQLGTLQDFLFRLNQSSEYKVVIGRQIKLPFFFTNTLRSLFFIFFTSIAFLWDIDIIESIDPFKLYKPLSLGVIGSVFAGILLLASLFVYRPWCHFFCPFGLVGWLVEKISRVKISVNYKTCIACLKCASACPSTVMEAILKRHKRAIPDCFACYTCRQICPTDSIMFSSRKRTLPPPGHFDKIQKPKRS